MSKLKVISLHNLYDGSVYSTFTPVRDFEQYELFVEKLKKVYPNMEQDTHWTVRNNSITNKKIIGIFVYPKDNKGNGRYGICGAEHTNKDYMLDFCNYKKSIALKAIKSLKE